MNKGIDFISGERDFTSRDDVLADNKVLESLPRKK